VLNHGAPQMLVLAAFALFVYTIVALSGILHSGVLS